MKDALTVANDRDSTVARLHCLHLQSYMNLLIIVLHRPYMLETPEHLGPQQRYDLSSTARKFAREAAANLTAIASKLIALDLVDLSSHMFVTTTMTAAQIHLFEIKTAEGLTRQFARNQFNLHVLILKQLQRTYWTASYQHQLFTETLKAMEEYEKGLRQVANTTADANVNSIGGQGATPGLTASGQTSTGTAWTTQSTQIYTDDIPDDGLTGLDELFLSFNPNPFLNLTVDADHE